MYKRNFLKKLKTEKNNLRNKKKKEIGSLKGGYGNKNLIHVALALGPDRSGARMEVRKLLANAKKAAKKQLDSLLKLLKG